MRAHIRNALASDRTQPEPGEVYVMCRHIKGGPQEGFEGAHVIRVLDPMMRIAPRNRLTDVMAEELPPAWLFLCDRCYERHDSGADNGEIVGVDGIWPEDTEVTYTELASEES